MDSETETVSYSDECDSLVDHVFFFYDEFGSHEIDLSLVEDGLVYPLSETDSINHREQQDPKRCYINCDHEYATIVFVAKVYMLCETDLHKSDFEYSYVLVDWADKPVTADKFTETMNMLESESGEDESECEECESESDESESDESESDESESDESESDESEECESESDEDISTYGCKVDMSRPHPYSGFYTMRLSGKPTYAVWFKSDDKDRPTFFLDSTMFRPQLHTSFSEGVEYGVNLIFRSAPTMDRPVLERIMQGEGGSAGLYLYVRS